MLRDVALFLAMRDGQPVGRVAAFVNPSHQARHGARDGHFGFLDADPRDPEAVAALLGAAEAHLGALGCDASIGPFSAWIYDVVGLQAAGFDTPDALMMPHHAEGLAERVMQRGYAPAATLLAYSAEARGAPARPPVVAKLMETVEADPALRVRPADRRRFGAELDRAMSIFNDAWSDNWGHLPFPPRKVAELGGELRPLLARDDFLFGELDGEPIAFVVVMPNLNEATAPLDGRLLPFGWARLGHRVLARRFDTTRMALMGLRRAHHKSRAGVALIVTLFETALEAMARRGVQRCELSWVLEQNRDVRRLIGLSGATESKRYLMLRKAL